MTIKPDTLRAAHLDAILDDYCSQSSPTENLIDILADAMHWCLLNGERFEGLLKTARMHIEFEVDNLPPPLPGRLSPIGEKLFSLAKELADFANDYTESLSFEDYVTVTELETKLLAYGNLLETRDRVAFLNSEYSVAEELLEWLKSAVQLLVDERFLAQLAPPLAIPIEFSWRKRMLIGQSLRSVLISPELT